MVHGDVLNDGRAAAWRPPTSQPTQSPARLDLSHRLRPLSSSAGASRFPAMIPDLATRVYNHTFRIDPIVRTLLDTDFYKLLMLQMIWKLHGHRKVTFELINRAPA